MELLLEGHRSLVFGEERRQTMVRHIRLRKPCWHSGTLLLALKKMLALQTKTVETAAEPSDCVWFNRYDPGFLFFPRCS